MRHIYRSLIVGLLISALAVPGVATPQAGPAKAPAKKTESQGKSSAAQTQSASAPKPSLEGIDAFIAEQLKEWKTPGVAVAVVQADSVILMKGYGFRDMEKQLPVTPQTLFAIGSITKSFTVTTLGMLADDGKLDWDKPVHDYLPRFQLFDPVASERATPRDLVSHRTGLPRHDLLWYGSPLSRMELFERLRHLEPSKDFRQLYQYNNLMFMTAGILVQELTGMKWEEAVRARLFTPLGMRNSNFSVNDSQKTGDFAQPYREAKEQLKLVPFRNIDEVGPAGSINSSAEDMIRYVQMHMNKGKLGEKQFLSAGMSTQMQSPQTVMPGEPQFAELGVSSYCMGLTSSTYRGRRLIGHGGAIDGFNAHISWMPAERIGVVILANRSGATILNTLSRYIYDRLLGLDIVPWSARIKEQQAKQKASEEEAKKKGYTAKREGTRASHDLKEYAGEYEHPGYGVIRVAQASDALSLTYNHMTSPLKHFHYDIFEVPENELDPFEGTKVSFFSNVKGDIGSLSLPIEPALPDITFKRKGEKVEKGTLEKLVGQYVLGATTITVALQPDGKLTLTVPGQPTYELVPTRGLSFDVKGLPGFSIEFKQDASGAVMEAAFFQPNGTFVAKKKI
jgi:CubicO group peptidase (beta-lactamase class C family)